MLVLRLRRVFYKYFGKGKKPPKKVTPNQSFHIKMKFIKFHTPATFQLADFNVTPLNQQWNKPPATQSLGCWRIFGQTLEVLFCNPTWQKLFSLKIWHYSIFSHKLSQIRNLIINTRIESSFGIDFFFFLLTKFVRGIWWCGCLTDWLELQSCIKQNNSLEVKTCALMNCFSI